MSTIIWVIGFITGYAICYYRYRLVLKDMTMRTTDLANLLQEYMKGKP